MEEVTKRMFEVEDLARFQTVLPGAYSVYTEKGRSMSTLNENNDKLSHLMIQASFQSSNHQEIFSDDQSTPCSPSKRKLEVLSCHLSQRKLQFEKSLQKIVHNHHIKFLKDYGIDPQDLYSADRIKRWHPRFSLSNVPNVEPDLYFLPPDFIRRVYKPVSAADLLGETAGTYITRQVKSALDKIAHRVDVSSPKKAVSELKPQSDWIKTTNVDPALLSRIREKEKVGEMKKMLRDRNTDAKLEMIERLPSIVRSLNNLFKCEKVTSLQLEKCVAKIEESCDFTNISQESIEEHLKLLSESVPEWLKIVSLPGAIGSRKNMKYAKMSDSLNVNDVITKINQQLAKLKDENP